MVKVYRARFLRRLSELKNSGELVLSEAMKTDWYNFIKTLEHKEWVVYAKEPFGGAAQVVEYLGRYTHKVAISNHRIKQVDDNGVVTFDYKDYADHNKIKQMTLPPREFIRRFEQHILPRYFCKIRSYGLYGNRKRHARVNMILKRLHLPEHPVPCRMPWQVKFMERYGSDPLLCPCCKKAQMVLVQIVHNPRGAVKKE